MNVSRRHFVYSVATAAGAAMVEIPTARGQDATSPALPESISGAIVICNHWTQYGIGETFPEGEQRGRWYQHNYSTVFGFEQGRRWLEKDPRNRVCHEFDAYFLDALAAEDPGYIRVLKEMIEAKRMELPGGTFGQAESQVFGYESALRQLTFGQAAYRRHLGRGCDTFIVEEQNFYPQLPQLLRLAGFKYASIQFQNSGTPDPSPHDLIAWEAMDGSSIPTVPNHPGMVPCPHQWKSYDDAVAQLAGRRSPLVFQWIELWPAGLDWGASLAPYAEAVRALEGKGFRQMLLTEYIEWALGRGTPPRVRIPLDASNYNNNFFQGGWGYENEKTARGSNRCESLLLAAEALCAGGHAKQVAKGVGGRLGDLWTRVLIAQNHDPYLAGSVPATVDGLRTYQSELAVKQLRLVQQTLQDEGGLGAPLACDGKVVRFFNPCPWEVLAPVLLELDETVWPAHLFQLTGGASSACLAAAFRSDSGRVLLGPALLRMGGYGTRDLRLEPLKKASEETRPDLWKLSSGQGGRIWTFAREAFTGIEFEPLVGEWKQAPTYFTATPPNINAEAVHTRIEEAPVTHLMRWISEAMEAASWRQDLMRIREVEVPALAVHGLVFAGESQTPFVQFNQRLTGTIRFETGPRPHGTWRFRIRVPAAGLRVFADAPFSEEERRGEHFYCARYVRLEWPGRQLLWCPSQNTLFRRITEGGVALIECTVFDFSFTGTANWGMRFHAASSFSPAESMRLAEAYHRSPIRIPSGASAGQAAGLAVDNPHVLITHVFPAGGGAVAVRALNASPERQNAVIAWPGGCSSVCEADLEGHRLPAAQGSIAGSRKHWARTFRPWEVATFHVKTSA